MSALQQSTRLPRPEILGSCALYLAVRVSNVTSSYCSRYTDDPVRPKTFIGLKLGAKVAAKRSPIVFHEAEARLRLRLPGGGEFKSNEAPGTSSGRRVVTTKVFAD
jgi:hypothetical protein